MFWALPKQEASEGHFITAAWPPSGPVAPNNVVINLGFSIIYEVAGSVNIFYKDILFQGKPTEALMTNTSLAGGPGGVAAWRDEGGGGALTLPPRRHTPPPDPAIKVEHPRPSCVQTGAV